MLKLEIKGKEDMRRRLERRFNALEKKTIEPALLAFAEPIRANTEQLARSLISPRMEVVTQIRRRGSTWQVRIGPSKKEFRKTLTGKTVTHAMIGYFFEFGYDIRAERRGPALAHVGERPSLTPAYEANKAAALEAFERLLKQALEQDVAA